MAGTGEKIIWGLPRVVIQTGHARGRYRCVDYDMWSTCERLSEEAWAELKRFITAYYRTHVPPPPPKRARPGGTTSRVSGYLEVYREHAEEFAARVLVFITDPDNLELDGGVQTADVIREVDEWATRHGRPTLAERIAAERRKVVAEYPDLVDDPLGEVPGAKREN